MTGETPTKKPPMDARAVQNADGPLALTLCEAAALLHCGVVTVRRLVKSGRLDGFSLGGRSGVVTRVTAVSVRRFIDGACGRGERSASRESRRQFQSTNRPTETERRGT